MIELEAIEHHLARQNVAPLNAESLEIKQRLRTLRIELTTLITELRWGGVSVQDTAQRLIALMQVGPLPQWVPTLAPCVLEVDRAGNFLPAWLTIIEQAEPVNLPSEVDPAETSIGRVRRFAILMLGYYKSPDLSHVLGFLARDATTSRYASQALLRQATTAALSALLEALQQARGWAKVDVVEACLAFHRLHFDEFVLANGLEGAAGLERAIAVPMFRGIALERYLHAGDGVGSRLGEQAALVFDQVVLCGLDSASDTLPVVFERDLLPLASALLEGARLHPCWHYALTLHHLALLLGRYWSEMARQVPLDTRIGESISACLPLMPEIECWMNERGRNLLLERLNSSGETPFMPAIAEALRQLSG